MGREAAAGEPERRRRPPTKDASCAWLLSWAGCSRAAQEGRRRRRPRSGTCARSCRAAAARSPAAEERQRVVGLPPPSPSMLRAGPQLTAPISSWAQLDVGPPCEIRCWPASCYTHGSGSLRSGTEASQS